MVRKYEPKLSVLLFAFVLLLGCATTLPPPEVMKADVSGYQLPKQPADGEALVYVLRPSGYFGSVRLTVFLDNEGPGSHVGSTTGNQYICFGLSPGSHKILSRGENLAEVGVSAKAGDVIFIHQEAAMPILREARNSLSLLNEYEGRYLVKNITMAPGIYENQSKTPLEPAQAPSQASSMGPIFVGTITGGNWAKGFGFSNINIKFFVTSDSGVVETFFVRSDSKVFDVSGKQVEYKESWGHKGHKVEIQHFIIQDATGGEPGRSDFQYEVGQKGVAVLRFLN
jgi:hypothetical protein